MCLSAEWKDQAKTKLNLTNARNWVFFVFTMNLVIEKKNQDKTGLSLVY